MLKDKVCIVTGSGGGIGRATAQEMATRGAKVVVTDFNDDAGAETVKLIEADGGEVTYIHCDVREEEQIENLMEKTVEHFGGIDVLHNNAGTHETYFTDHALLEELPTDIWMKVIEINLRGPWLTTKHAMPHLRRSKNGPNIVNCGSTGGLLGFSPGSAYCPSKAGVIHLTRVTAIEVAPHVRCNSYCPGSSDTYMVQRYMEAAEDKEAAERGMAATHLIPRLGYPKEIANLVCFLASDEASFITGANYVADGGALAWRGSHT